MLTRTLISEDPVNVHLGGHRLCAAFVALSMAAETTLSVVTFYALAVMNMVLAMVMG